MTMSPLFLNRDVLLHIAGLASVGPCGQWVQLAVMRLVCKSWAFRIAPHSDMRRALKRDIASLPICCIDLDNHYHVRVMTHPRRKAIQEAGRCSQGFFCSAGLFFSMADDSLMTIPMQDGVMPERIFYALRRWHQFPFSWSAFPPLMVKYFQMEQRGVQSIDHDYVMAYVVPVGPPERRFYFGPAPRSYLDCCYLTKQLGVDAIINMRPLTDAKTGSGHNQAESYLTHWTGKDEDMQTAPVVLRMAAVPSDAIENQSDARQIDFYVSVARKVAAWMREHDKARVFIHQHDGTHHEAYVAFLVWYLLDKASSPHDTLQAWLEKQDYLQVLRDDVQMDLFAQMIKQADKTSKSNALQSWLKKRKT